MSWRLGFEDTAWLNMESAVNPMIITGLMWLDEPLDIPTFKKLLEERVLRRFPIFTQAVKRSRVPGRRPSWVPERNFSIDRHLTFVRLPAPGGQAELQAFVSQVLSKQMRLDRSPWHVYLIDGYEGGAAMLARIHHALGDGISLAQVLLGLTDVHKGPVAQASPMPKVPSPVQGRGVRDLATAGAQSLAKLLLSPADPGKALHGKLSRTKRAVWSAPIPVEAVKAIGKPLGATINDVMISALSGGLQRYISARGEQAEQLHSFIPYNLRPLDRPVPERLGNKFGMVILPLPTVRTSARERIALLKRRMDEIKSSLDPIVTYGLISLLGGLPKHAEKIFVRLLGSKASLIVTNVPGPKQKLELAGSPVGGILVWVPQSSSVGLGVAIFSYAGEITVGISCDAHVVPNPEEILEGMNAELAELAAGAGVRVDLIPGSTAEVHARTAS